jgi:hypothetical protein
MDPLTIAMTAASLGGSILGNKAQEKAADQAEAQRQANMGLIQDYGQRAIQSLTPGYQNAQAIRQQALNQNLGLTGSTFRPMIESVQAGDFMGQQALLAGLMGQRNAILGDPINYGNLQAQNVPVNYGALSGLTSPQGLEFTPMEAPDLGDQAQTSWNAFNSQQYMAANPDIAADYAANKSALLAGGDPQFRTEEGYAKWHYDNYGKAEGRPTAPATQGAATDGAVFTSEQVNRAISGMG